MITWKFREAQTKVTDSQPQSTWDWEMTLSAATQGPKRTERPVCKQDTIHTSFNCLGYWSGGWYGCSFYHRENFNRCKLLEDAATYLFWFFFFFGIILEVGYSLLMSNDSPSSKMLSSQVGFTWWWEVRFLNHNILVMFLPQTALMHMYKCSSQVAEQHYGEMISLPQNLVSGMRTNLLPFVLSAVHSNLWVSHFLLWC